MNTSQKPLDWHTNWPVRPALPDPPASQVPSVWDAYERDKAEHEAMYREIDGKPSRQRSNYIRALLIAGWRALRNNQAETNRLAVMGKEWEQTFGDIRPGQLANLFDRLTARQPADNSNTGPTLPAPPPPSSGQERSERIHQFAASLPEGDPLEGEFGD